MKSFVALASARRRQIGIGIGLKILMPAGAKMRERTVL
jgi:hypothetical protein